jgi:hypothetical protein
MYSDLSFAYFDDSNLWYFLTELLYDNELISKCLKY